MLIKIILLVLVVAMTVYVGFVAGRTKAQASKKLLFTLFVLFMVTAIAWPGLTNDIAHALGVGRGADLLLYALAVTFVFFVVGVYARFQGQRDELHKLARYIALRDVQKRR